MKKNPFSLFDFLGYLFPGALGLFLIYFISKVESIESITSLYNEVKTIRIPLSFEDTILMTIVSYVLGHLVAYISSLTVEQFSIWLYGYPSRFLLHDVEGMHYWQLSKDEIKPWRRLCKYVWRCVIGLFLLPLTICSLFFAKLFGVKYFFIKKLDDVLISTIKTKTKELQSYLRITGSSDMDYHRVIYHYEYEQQKTHATKMDNYVALYGFLRSVTLVFNCFSLYLIYIAISSFNLDYDIDWKFIRLLILSIIVTYLFFMSFMKFYRRFTLESFMCLIIDKSYLTDKPIKLM